jgi:hypothetical protein
MVERSHTTIMTHVPCVLNTVAVVVATATVDACHCILMLCRLQLIARVAGAAAGPSRGASEDPDAAGEEEEEMAAGGKGKRKQGKGKGGNALRGAGLAGLKLDPTLLEGDFDPDKWDEQMAAAFNDDYYVSLGWGMCPGGQAGGLLLLPRLADMGLACAPFAWHIAPASVPATQNTSGSMMFLTLMMCARVSRFPPHPPPVRLPPVSLTGPG